MMMALSGAVVRTARGIINLEFGLERFTLDGATLSSLDVGCYVLYEANSSSQGYKEVSRLCSINRSDGSDFGFTVASGNSEGLIGGLASLNWPSKA